MEETKKEIERLIQISTLRDIQIRLKEAQIAGMVISEIVFEIVKDLEDSYSKLEN